MSSDFENLIPIDNCTLQTCNLTRAYQTYDPSLTANALYVAIFGVLLLIQTVQGYYYRTWTYTAGMLLGLSGEIIGYVGRIQMHFNPFLANPFLIYLSCLTISPVFLSAVIYICLSRIVVIYGVEYSRFQPMTYTTMFISCDFFALVLQAVGGAIADTNLTNQRMQDIGVHIMVAGLAFQVASLLLFSLICIEYAWRVSRYKGTRNTKEYSYLTHKRYFHFFLCGVASATLFIITRSIYRLIELQGGFASKLANDEVLLMVLDGAMIVLAGLVLTIFHPGMTLEGNWDLRPSKAEHGFETITSSKENVEEMGVIGHDRFKPSTRQEVHVA